MRILKVKFCNLNSLGETGAGKTTIFQAGIYKTLIYVDLSHANFKGSKGI